MAAIDFDEFQGVRFFSALDGIRAISVLLVIVWHMPEKGVWGPLNGFAGVQAFFVLSGFLITTLCIREMAGAADGKLSLRGFYGRRVHRILPLYLITLAAYALLTAIEFIPSWSEFVEHLPYYLTFNGDLIVGSHPFQHSWTLGVEEKFYIVWPLLLVLALRWRSTARIAATGAGLIILSVLAATGSDYATFYLGITFGCLLAFTLADRRTFNVIRRGAGSRMFVVLTVSAAVITHLLLRRVAGLTLPYAILVGGTIACILLRPTGGTSRSLSRPPAQWIGQRSYGIYLVHPILIHTVDHIVAPTGGLLLATGRLAASIVLSFGVADLLHRSVETPMIARGRRLFTSRSS